MGFRSEQDQVGVLAQELESAAPYMIERSKDKLYPGGIDTDVLYVDPTPLIFILMNALRELRNEVEKL